MRRNALSLGIAILAVTGIPDVTLATDRFVPDPFPQIQNAINASSAGDRVIVTVADTYDPFVLDKSVEVTKSIAGEVKINGTGSTYAARIIAFGGKITGLTLWDGSSYGVEIGPGTVDGCRVIDSTGTGYAESAVLLNGGGILRNSVVKLSLGKAQAVDIDFSSDAQVTGNTLTISDAQSGNYEAIRVKVSGVLIQNNKIEFLTQEHLGRGVSVYPAATNGSVLDNTFTGAATAVEIGAAAGWTVKRNIIEHSSTGIWLFTSALQVVENNTVYRSSCGTGSLGIYQNSSSGTGQVNKNLLVNVWTGIFVLGGVTTDSYDHNIYWGGSPACGSSNNCGLTSDQIGTKEPLFCQSHEASVAYYTQRIDSEASTGNNGWGELVGARDVECAWGTLSRTSTVAANSQVTVLEDVVVPSGKSLYIQEGVDFRFDAVDQSGGGSGMGRNDLIVNGGLTVTGTAGNRAKFRSISATPAEGDWYGINAQTAQSMNVNFAEVKHADYGILTKTSGTGTVADCVFSDNAIQDIRIGSGGASVEVTVTRNTITVGSATGIKFTGICDGAVVSSNTITGDGSSAIGIDHGQSGSTSSPTFTSNTISGFDAGDGILNTNGDPTLTGNTVADCKYGVRVTGGTPRIGTTDSQSDNFINGGNVHGIFVLGSSAAPVIRNNRINFNKYGVTKKSSGSPDLGTMSSPGNNDLSADSTYCVWNQTSVGITAIGNFFGDCNGSGDPPVCWSGLLFVEDNLCLPPAGFQVDVEPVPPVRPLVVLGAWPNPARAGTAVRFALDAPAENVGVDIFAVGGRLVRSYAAGSYEWGEHEFVWDGRNEAGVPVPGGLYLVRVSVDDRFQQATRVVVAR